MNRELIQNLKAKQRTIIQIVQYSGLFVISVLISICAPSAPSIEHLLFEQESKSSLDGNVSAHLGFINYDNDSGLTKIAIPAGINGSLSYLLGNHISFDGFLSIGLESAYGVSISAYSREKIVINSFVMHPIFSDNYSPNSFTAGGQIHMLITKNISLGSIYMSDYFHDFSFRGLYSGGGSLNPTTSTNISFKVNYNNAARCYGVVLRTPIIGENMWGIIFSSTITYKHMLNDVKLYPNRKNGKKQ